MRCSGLGRWDMLNEAERSPFVHVMRGGRFRVRFDRQLPYELDGGARPAAGKPRIKVHPSSVRICVPADVTDTSLALLDQPAQVPANG